MELSEPKQITFWIAVVLVVIGLIIAFFTDIAEFDFWFVLAGFILLALGNLLKGL